MPKSQKSQKSHKSQKSQELKKSQRNHRKHRKHRISLKKNIVTKSQITYKITEHYKTIEIT